MVPLKQGSGGRCCLRQHGKPWHLCPVSTVDPTLWAMRCPDAGACILMPALFWVGMDRAEPTRGGQWSSAPVQYMW